MSVKQRIGENQMSVEELKNMINRGETLFASRVMRFSSSLHGTRQYCCTQRLNLTAMQETLGMPTIFFKLSAADTQWPEVQDLMRHNRPNANQDKARERIKAGHSKSSFEQLVLFAKSRKIYAIHFAKQS